MNLIYLIIELIICYALLVLLYKKYQNNGLYTYIIIMYLLANIMSLKTIDLLDFKLNLGIIPFISIFTSTNIIIQKRGKDEIKKLIIILLSTSILSYLVLLLASKMDSSIINLFTNASFDNIFMDCTRIFFTNMTTFLYMLYFNSILYSYLKKEKNKIWISNIFSTIIIHFFATPIFILLGYAITTSINDIIEMLLIRYVVSIIIGILGTIVIYINCNKIKEK